MYRLALTVGEWDVQGMLSNMSVSQLADWITYSQLEPFGPDREDFRAGLMCSTVANVNLDTSKSEPLTAFDFMPLSQWAEHHRKNTAKRVIKTDTEWNMFLSKMRTHTSNT